MAVRKGFESFADIVDTFVKSEIGRFSDALTNQAAMRGEDTHLYTTIPIVEGEFLSSIRDVDDGVMYFMVGFDRVNGPSKTGA